jgi:hypothetical protein
LLGFDKCIQSLEVGEAVHTHFVSLAVDLPPRDAAAIGDVSTAVETAGADVDSLNWRARRIRCVMIAAHLFTSIGFIAMIYP